MSAVAEGLVLADGEACVEQEDALPCPARQVAALRDGRTGLGLYLLEDVLKGRRELRSVLHAEAKAVRLSGSMIRVLPQDDDAHLVEGRRVEGIEDEAPGRVARAGGVLLAYELRQLGEVRLAKLLGKLRSP